MTTNTARYEEDECKHEGACGLRLGFRTVSEVRLL